MSQELLILSISAASMGFFHTLLGPDHYLPFIVMARIGKWSPTKITWVTGLCGIGHVGSSVSLGMIGVALGIAVTKLEAVESFCASLVAWTLIAFGLAYFIWGLRCALRNRPHKHWHTHGDGSDHLHMHTHSKEHMHVHIKENTTNLTPWVLFIILVFGPCEPLIPILMYPAAKISLFSIVWVASIFCGVTIITMLSIVLTSSFGVNLLPLPRLERYAHALAGAAICICGIAIQSLGL